MASTRQTRRGVARRAIIEESDDELDAIQQPLPVAGNASPARRSNRRAANRSESGDVASPSKPTGRARRTTATEVEPSEVLTSSINEPSEPSSPTRRAPAARKSIRASRRSRISIATDETDVLQSLPTPKASASPEPSLAEDTENTENVDTTITSPKPAPMQIKQERDVTPLSDITEVAVNRQGPDADETIAPIVTKVEARVVELEKPMDIVVRTRSAAIAKSQEPQAPKQRTVITYLVLTNFKSYAGRQEVGPFHASFSSVVGPNGSGKSNVIDSLLFVFGFRASKMRQGKVSALIHNSAAFPDLDHCEVEVHFQEVMDLPEGGVTVIPESTLVISRRAFKNNSSSYYINGKSSNFTIVTTLLRERGVDLDHKRFLILQGEVESIAQMKPKAGNEHEDGLLEYLEDIIGTSKYKTPIDESATETETLNEVCLEKSTRVQHVEKEKSGLEDKKEKALAFIRNENELATKQSALYQIYIADCNNNLEVYSEAAVQLQAQLDEELQRHAGGEEEIKQLEKQYKAGAKSFATLEKETQAVIKEAEKLDKENVKFEEKKKFLAGKQKKASKTLETSKFGISESETLMKQYTDDIERNTEQIAELEESMKSEEKELETIRESLKGKTQGLSDEIAKKQKSLDPWNEKINEKQSAIAVAQSELDILLEKDSAGAKAIAEMEDRITGYTQSKQAKQAEADECKSQTTLLEKQLRKMEVELEKLNEQEPALRSKLSGARQKANDARASLSSTQTQGNVLTGLMRLKETGRISGFHGRLGNLGTIDQKYDVAISTACPALDNLVVDSVEIGQQCIDYLRKNNLGRANFILLDRLPQRDLSQIEAPENVSRLFDLVKPKQDKFRPAFFSVLQNTLVAKDLEQANRIAYGARRWRVVTLDGQLIDKSGTMSGGGTRVAKGGMSSKLACDVTKEQVSVLEVDRSAIEKEFQDFRRRQQELEAEVREVKTKLPRLETQLQKLQLEVESFERNITDAKQRLQELASEQQPSKSDKTRATALEKSIASLDKEVAKLRAETAGIEEAIKALQDKIMEIGGVKLRSQKAKVDGIKEQIDTLTSEMSNAEVSKAKAEKQKAKHEKTSADATKELAGIERDLEKVENDMLAQNTSAGGQRQAAEDAQEALQTKRDELAELKKELDTKMAELNETRGAEIEMRNKLEENQKSLAEIEKRVRHWGDKLGKLTMQNISETGEEQEPTAPPTYTADELEDMTKEELKVDIEMLEKKTATAVELSVLGEYRRRVEEHATRSADLASAVAARDSAKKRCDELRRLRLEGFMEGFSAISLRLKEMYQMITMGGNAELELVDSLDPFSEGILFSVMPPKKSWKNISNLSGGEKTLSSLALVFALHHYKPTPLYILDEIDAALDFRNVSIIASYIKERTKNAQFIVISLRNNMFELAHRLVGVYKVSHMTKSVTVENRDYISNTG